MVQRSDADRNSISKSEEQLERCSDGGLVVGWQTVPDGSGTDTPPTIVPDNYEPKKWPRQSTGVTISRPPLTNRNP